MRDASKLRRPAPHRNRAAWRAVVLAGYLVDAAQPDVLTAALIAARLRLTKPLGRIAAASSRERADRPPGGDGFDRRAERAFAHVWEARLALSTLFPGAASG